MLGAGFLQSEAVLGKANEKLEQAIEELRVKYEKKAQVEAAEAAAKAKAAGAGGDDEGKKSKEEEMTMDDPDLEALRKSRIEALKSASMARKGHRASGHGELREIVEEDFLKDVTSTEFVCVHFMHPEFETCKVMNKHLRIIAARPSCMQTRFLRIEAPKAAFFVAKLKVKVLPTLIFFHNGVASGRLTGFEGLHILPPAGFGGGSGGAGVSSALAGGGSTGSASAAVAAGTDFTTRSLLRLLKLSGVLGSKAEEAAETDSDGGDEEGGGGGLGIGAGGASAAEARRRFMMASLEKGTLEDD